MCTVSVVGIDQQTYVPYPSFRAPELTIDVVGIRPGWGSRHMRLEEVFDSRAKLAYDVLDQRRVGIALGSRGFHCDSKLNTTRLEGPGGEISYTEVRPQSPRDGSRNLTLKSRLILIVRVESLLVVRVTSCKV